VLFSALVVSDSTNKIKNDHSPSRMNIFIPLAWACVRKFWFGIIQRILIDLGHFKTFFV